MAAAVAASGRRLVVLDDDPTGTQTVADVPVLTTWTVDDLRWGLRQPATALYVLTNTRSLSPPDAATRLREVVGALVVAARSEGVETVVAVRGDSTLRGHYPLEPDVVAAELTARAGVHVDGVLLVPAYVEAGRLTVDSTHWARGPHGLLPVGETEFARDATFGYRASDLREYVTEKSGGRWAAQDVARVTLHDIAAGVEAVAGILRRLDDGHPVVVDAACDADLRLVALAAMRVEAEGRVLLYRSGPSFVRARAGQAARPPLDAPAVAALRGSPDRAAHGLIVVGSHVAQTTRQLERLRAREDLRVVTLDAAGASDAGRASELIRETADSVAAALVDGDVVVQTSRALVTGTDAAASLAIARAVSAALVAVVRAVVAQRAPAWLVAKGGITASDVATAGVGVHRAWVRGTLLPGIVSLWEPIDGAARGVPYVVFAGNVGDDDALVRVVGTLREAGRCS